MTLVEVELICKAVNLYIIFGILSVRILSTDQPLTLSLFTQ